LIITADFAGFGSILCEMRLIGVFLLCLAVGEGQLVTFDLTDYQPGNKTTEVHKAFVNLTAGVAKVQVINVPSNVGFFVIQVHAYRDNVTLSSTRKMKSHTTIKGTNVGLVSFSHEDTTFYVKNKNDTKALIVIVIYDTKGKSARSTDKSYSFGQQIPYPGVAI
jgi:hypothetical protein